MGLREVDDAVIAALIADVRTSREHFDSGTELLRVASGQIALLKEDLVRVLAAMESKASALQLAETRAAVERIRENCARIQSDKEERQRASREGQNVHHRGLWAIAAAAISAVVMGAVEVIKWLMGRAP